MKCKECGKEFSRSCDLSLHVGKYHGSQKGYYDKYLKKEGEGICPCGKETKYSGKWQRGYLKYCSDKCKKEGRALEIEKTTVEKYGVKNVNQLKKVRDKIEKTNLKKYGNSCPMQNQKIRKKIIEKNMENLGVEFPFQSSEIQGIGKAVRMKKYGVENIFSLKKFRIKSIDTCQKKYGADYAFQNPEIFEKAQKKKYKLNEYKNTGIIYQASYELDFLEKYYSEIPEIIRGPSIKYMLGKKKKVYHSDFFIPSKNLIVEIKNGYLAKRDENILSQKKLYCEMSGYGFIMIIDKNYSEFEDIIS